MKCVSRTHVGNVRSTNQDSLLIQPRLYGVADGMGGHKAGDIASRMAVLMLSRVLEGATPSEALLRAAIEEVNALIYEEQKKNPDYAGMGTTLTVLWEGKGFVLLGHVGDSRAYLRRKGKLTQMTNDHSIVGELLQQGMITKENAFKHPYRNVITRAVGTDEVVEPDIMQFDVLPGDQWVICSDGLTGYVTDEEIAHVLSVLPAENAADMLLQQALDQGGCDNISLVITEVSQ